MTVPGKGGRPKGRTDEKLNEGMSNNAMRHAIFAGATMYDLEQLFQVGKRTVQRRVGNIAPTGTRSGHPTWLVKDVAGLFVKPTGRMEEFIRSAKAADMPPELQKEYWNGQIAKQKFHQLEGNLWSTDRVLEVVSEVIKITRTSLLLLPDELERDGGLDQQQRDIIERSIDGMLQKLRETVQEQFDRPPVDADIPGSSIMDKVYDEDEYLMNLGGDDEEEDDGYDPDLQD